MPQPSHHAQPTSRAEMDWAARQQEPNHSYVSSCAVDSAQQSSGLMDWAGAVPSAAADAPQAVAPSGRHATLRTSGHPGNNVAAALPAHANAWDAAAVATNPWAWLSDTAAGGGRSAAAAGATANAAAAADKGASLHCHNTSRRLFTSDARNPAANMQWRLQQQAQQLQAELALATQQLQMHSIAFTAAAPAVTLAG